MLDPRHANWARAVILFAAAITTGLSLIADQRFAFGTAIALVGSAYVLFTTHQSERDGGRLTRVGVAVSDIALISVIVWATGGIESEYYLLYFIPALAAGLRMDADAGIAACVACACFYSVTALTAPPVDPVLPFAVVRLLSVGAGAFMISILFVVIGRAAEISSELRDTLHHSLRRVAAVYEVAHAANSGADLTSVLEVILDHAARSTKAVNGSVFMEQDGELRAMASLVAPSQATDALDASSAEPARRAIETRRPVTCSAPQPDGPPASVIYIPLFTPTGAVGVLSLAMEGDGRSANRRMDFLVSLCAEAAVAIENAQLRAELRRLAVTDPLTGLINRREVEARLRLEIDRSARSGRPVALLMIDVDNLKAVNDTYGHAVGDEALIAVARLMADTIRSSEIAGRIGGDEFAVVLPETDTRQAVVVADTLVERLRPALRGWSALPDPEGIARIIGVSVGVAASCGEESAADLMKSADSALYQAKRRGRGQAAVAERPLEVATDPACSVTATS